MSFNPGGHFINAPDCPACGEPVEEPSTEAFELSGELVRDDCAEAIFEDNSQFGVGA